MRIIPTLRQRYTHTLQYIRSQHATSHIMLFYLNLHYNVIFIFGLMSESCITQYNTIVRLATCKGTFLCAVCAVSNWSIGENAKGKKCNLWIATVTVIWEEYLSLSVLPSAGYSGASHGAGSFQSFLCCKPAHDDRRCFCSKQTKVS